MRAADSRHGQHIVMHVAEQLGLFFLDTRLIFSAG